MNLAQPPAAAGQRAADPPDTHHAASPGAAPVRASDVVAYLLTRLGPLQQLRLQKLLYYCQAWRVAYRKPPLFCDPIEAWAAGPVVPNVWRDHAYEYTVESEPNGNLLALAPDQIQSIEAVLERYLVYSGNELSQLTHREDPWIIARGDLPEGARCRQTISLESMWKFYSQALPNVDVAVADYATAGAVPV